ncbi:MAG: hypothetical protein JOZ54_13585 [Acidobacteria bacterium]|nr:hypothetical protein [Acidobacteriota bacterium]
MSDGSGGGGGLDEAERAIEAEAAQNGGTKVEAVMGCRKQETRVRIVVKDERFRVVRDLPYTLKVGEEEFRGTIDGVIEHVIKQKTGRGTLEVTFGEDDVAKWDLTLEELDPLSLDTGASERLRALMPLEAELDDEYATAVGSLRDAFGLEDAQAIDSATRELIERVYSADDTPADELAEWMGDGAEEVVASAAASLRKIELPALKLLEEPE